jgi:hypothetical protein
MSKHETKMTRWYAKLRYPKGFLMEEYLAAPQVKTKVKRLMDGGQRARAYGRTTWPTKGTA